MEYFEPKIEIKTLSALSVIFVCLSCQQNLFPIYSELKEKNVKSHTIVFGSACLLVCFLYITMSIIALFMFGDYNVTETTILNMISNHQLKNCTPFTEGHVCENLDKPWTTYALRIIFLIVLFCHIPFIFFSGKEAILIAIDELDRCSISRALEFKMMILR